MTHAHMTAEVAVKYVQDAVMPALKRAASSDIYLRWRGLSFNPVSTPFLCLAVSCTVLQSVCECCKGEGCCKRSRVSPMPQPYVTPTHHSASGLACGQGWHVGAQARVRQVCRTKTGASSPPCICTTIYVDICISSLTSIKCGMCVRVESVAYHTVEQHQHLSPRPPAASTLPRP